MAWPRVIPITALLATVVILGGFRSPPDASGPSRRMPVWRDEKGQIIAQMAGGEGILYLYTRDQAGRIVRVEAQAGAFDPKSKTIPGGGTPLWIHAFEYDHAGRLIHEFDCLGSLHSFNPEDHLPMVPQRGTVLTSHRHGGKSAPPPQPSRRSTTVLYDELGRILSTNTERDDR